MTLLLALSPAFCDERTDWKWLMGRGTTDAYKAAALEVLLSDVNELAHELDLHEKLPLKPGDLTNSWIATPWSVDHERRFGTVVTGNYKYDASVGNKLSSIILNFGPIEERRAGYMEYLGRRYLMPRSKLDTNAAYAMATQWLAKAGMDVAALERDAQSIQVTAWSAGNEFVPVYLVSWKRYASWRGENEPPKLDSVASIQFLAPERRIIQMNVSEAKYIKRKPLLVPDRDHLLQQTEDPKLRELWFTTEAYKSEALKAMLDEVNWFARALQLPEKFPIESTELADKLISTPFTADHGGGFAVVYTTNYSYVARQKLCSVSRPYRVGVEESCYLAAIRGRYTIPRSQMNFASAYNLATQWLAAVSVDLKQLEAGYPFEVNPLWVSEDQVVPLYTVEWVKPVPNSRRRDLAVRVEVLEPERSLEGLHIEKLEYLKRPPLVVPDREGLLQPPNLK